MIDKVGIGIFVWNGEKTIRNTIYSILNQSYRNIDIIVLDNQSTDKTANIVRDIQRKNKTSKSIKLIIDRKKRKIDKAFQYLVKKNLKKYFFSMILNDDDIIHKKYVAELLINIKKNNADLVYSDFNFITMSNKIYKPQPISLNFKFSKYPIYTKFNSHFFNLILFIFFKNMVPLLFGLFKTQSLLNSLKYFKYFDKTYSNYDALFTIHFLTRNKIDYINKKRFFYREKDRFRIYAERKNKEVITYTGIFSNIKNIYHQIIFSIKIFQIIKQSNLIKTSFKLLLYLFIILNYFWRLIINILKFFYGLLKIFRPKL
jgi:glycosyltransferase involved in cell wall biosynthesis